MTEIRNCAITHGGKFHADDVFSAALLKIINPDIKVVRAFEVPADFEGIVFDIGFGKFDHHQKDAEIRENGIPYAAFGLLWREFGEGILLDGCAPEVVKKEAQRFDERFIQPIDEDDNTGCGNQLAGVIGAFNPCWDSTESADTCFEEAMEFAFAILRNKINSITSIGRAKEFVEDALDESHDNIVVLSKFAPWKMTLVRSDAEFVVYPSQRGGFSAQGIPVDTDTTELKCPFPEKWAGKAKEELQKISGIKTLTFCHKGRFLVSADTLEDVTKACRLARRQSGFDTNFSFRMGEV